MGTIHTYIHTHTSGVMDAKWAQGRSMYAAAGPASPTEEGTQWRRECFSRFLSAPEAYDRTVPFHSACMHVYVCVSVCMYVRVLVCVLFTFVSVCMCVHIPFFGILKTYERTVPFHSACMHVYVCWCMYVCTYPIFCILEAYESSIQPVCVCVYMYVCIRVCMAHILKAYERTVSFHSSCMHVYMHMCMYVCMYVCTYHAFRYRYSA